MAARQHVPCLTGLKGRFKGVVCLRLPNSTTAVNPTICSLRLPMRGSCASRTEAFTFRVPTTPPDEATCTSTLFFSVVLLHNLVAGVETEVLVI